MELPENHDSTSPKVTFAIPTLNSSRTIADCLSSIEIQDYPFKEVLIIDSHSNDETISLTKGHADRILFSRGTLGECRQMGFKYAAGDLVAMWDDDIIIPHKRWLSGAVRPFSAGPSISTVWPLSVPPPGSTMLSRSRINYSWAFNLQECKKGRWVGGGGHSLFRKSLVEKVGGIDRPIRDGEDLYLANKLAKSGYSVVLHEDPLYHATHVSIQELVSKDRVRARLFQGEGYNRLVGAKKGKFAARQVQSAILSLFAGSVLDGDFSWLLLPILLMARGAALL
jgi:glycosyltransferase involved in cell wall biosynthesis